MKIEIVNRNSGMSGERWRIAAFDDNGSEMSHAGFSTLKSRFRGAELLTLGIGGIGTKPQCRRAGCVRQILSAELAAAPEKSCTVAMLHPFSYSYYAKFGFEKIADHLIVEFPISALDTFPRCADFVPVDSLQTRNDSIAVYEEFAKQRNIMFRRYPLPEDSEYQPETDPKSYVFYGSDGRPCAYIQYKINEHYWVNRMVSDSLEIREYAFTCEEGLLALFGFIRMFEGQSTTIVINNAAMTPEIDAAMSHYSSVKRTLVPDIMARAINTEALLAAAPAPRGDGHFTVAVTDTLNISNGIYRVEFSGGSSKVTRLSDSEKFDILADVGAFTRLVYGYDTLSAASLGYMRGVSVEGDAEDFLRMFTPQSNGLFEHF